MTRNLELLKGRLTTVAMAVAILGVLGVAFATRNQWLPEVRKWVASNQNKQVANGDHPDDGHAGHNHGHAGHDEANSLQLSEVARKNIGLRTGVVQPQSYAKTVTVPAIVVERPARSQVDITAPLTGIVTRVYHMESEAVRPGQPLFDLRLTHEDLVTAQREFLQSAQELDVVKREISRLRSVGEGVIAGRRILEQQYEKEKVEARMHAQRQGLLLHGLNDQQISSILETRRLLPTLTVSAPAFDEESEHHEAEHLYHIQRILVKRGQSVAAGESIGTLADHCLLYVEGQAFEDDADRLIQASRDGSMLEVHPAGNARARRTEVLRLNVSYVADQVDLESRALRFYLLLANQLSRDQSEDGHRFVAWKYRPGQRMEVEIPLQQRWNNQLVLPRDAVVTEGAEAFVFEQNGDHFDRVDVHVLFRDKDTAVVENDGSLNGSTIAMAGAYQMHLALKSKSGGAAPDPHAGHNH